LEGDNHVPFQDIVLYLPGESEEILK